MYDFRAFCTNNMSDFVHRDAYRNCNMFLLLGCYSTIVIVYPFVSPDWTWFVEHLERKRSVDYYG